MISFLDSVIISIGDNTIHYNRTLKATIPKWLTI